MLGGLTNPICGNGQVAILGLGRGENWQKDTPAEALLFTNAMRIALTYWKIRGFWRTLVLGCVKSQKTLFSIILMCIQ